MDRIYFILWSAEIAVLLKDCKKGKRIFGIEEENFVQEQKLKKILYLHSTENKYVKWRKKYSIRIIDEIVSAYMGTE